jgi:two-component system, NtrC family, sensor kinase
MDRARLFRRTGFRMNTGASCASGFALEGAAVDAVLDCVPSPILLLDSDRVLATGNAAARALDAWMGSTGFPLALARALGPVLDSTDVSDERGRWTGRVELAGADATTRSYEATLQRIGSGRSGAPSLALVLGNAASPVEGIDDAAPGPDRALAAHARLEDVQRQLLQADRMSSIGQLAAGVAHEINNPIGYIRSNLGTLAEYASSLMRLLNEQESALRLLRGTHPDALTRIEEIREEIDFDFLAGDLPMLLDESQEGIAKVCKIVQDLRDFSRAGHDEGWVATDIHAGLDSTINIVWHELKYKVELVKDYGELPPVTCLPSQLNQVFMNILVNAGQAIADRGKVSICTRADDQSVHVEIADDGSGIAGEHLARIFDPFFTTKPVGKGTGVGLSISYGIVKKHGGRIEVRSRPGNGTTFRISLPINGPQAGAMAQDGAPGNDGRPAGRDA